METHLDDGRRRNWWEMVSRNRIEKWTCDDKTLIRCALFLILIDVTCFVSIECYQFHNLVISLSTFPHDSYQFAIWTHTYFGPFVYAVEKPRAITFLQTIINCTIASDHIGWKTIDRLLIRFSDNFECLFWSFLFFLRFYLKHWIECCHWLM